MEIILGFLLIIGLPIVAIVAIVIITILFGKFPIPFFVVWIAMPIGITFFSKSNYCTTISQKKAEWIRTISFSIVICISFLMFTHWDVIRDYIGDNNIKGYYSEYYPCPDDFGRSAYGVDVFTSHWIGNFILFLFELVFLFILFAIPIITWKKSSIVYNRQGLYDNAKEHCNLGIVYYKKKLYDKGIEEYKEAIRIDPDCAEAHLGLGLAYYGEKGLYDEAIEEYKEAIRIKPDFAEVHFRLGWAYDEKGLDDKAIKEYKEAISIKPDFAWAHYNLGMVYFFLNRREDALDEYKILKKLDKEKANELFKLINK